MVPQWKMMVPFYKPVNYVIVRERKLTFDSEATNTNLGVSFYIYDHCQRLVKNEKLNEMKKWIAQLISDQDTPKLMREDAQIEKRI